MKRFLIIAVLALAVVGAFIGYRMYEQPVATAGDQAADVSVTAEDLYRAFSTDEAAAGTRFNDKVVQVTGTVREIGAEGDGPVNVLLDTGDDLGAVVCEFAHDQDPHWEKAAK